MRYGVVLILCCFAAGCSATPTQLARLDRANAELKANNSFAAFEAIAIELRLGGNRREKALKLFERAEISQTHLAYDFMMALERSQSFENAVTYVTNIRLAETVGLISTQRALELESEASQSVLRRTIAGEFKPLLTEDLHQYPAVKGDREAMRTITFNTLEYLAQSQPRENYRRPHIKLLAEYFNDADTSQETRQIIRDKVSTLAFTVRELEEDIRLIDRDFSARRIDEMTIDFFVIANRESRLMSIDIANAIGAFAAFRKVNREEDAEVTLKIDELEYREYSDDLPVRNYRADYYQAGAGYADCSMPGEAVFLYSVREGHARLDWAYEVTVSKQDDLMASEVLRGKIEKTSHECINPRVRDECGEITRSDDWPNLQTRSYCTRFEAKLTPRDLRDDVIEQTARQITTIIDQSTDR